MVTTLEKHQIAVLIIFIPLVFKMAMLPCLLADVAGRDMWLSVVLLLLLEIVQLVAILFIQKLGGMERLKKVVGRKWTSVIITPLVLVFMVKSVIFFNETVSYISSFLFYNIEDWSVAAALLIGIGYLALKGVKAMGRIAELSLIFIPFILFIGFSFGKVDLHFDYLLPILKNGAEPVLQGAWKYLFYAFDFSPLIFIGIAEKKKSPQPKELGLSLNINHKKKTLPWYFIGAALLLISVIVAFVLFIASYGDAAYLIDNAFARLAAFNVVTTEIGSIDWPAVILWLVMAMLCIALKMWGIGVVGDSYGMKREVVIIVAVIVLGVLATFVFKNVTEGIRFVESAWRFAVAGIEIFVTALIFTILLAAHLKIRSNAKEAENAA